MTLSSSTFSRLPRMAEILEEAGPFAPSTMHHHLQLTSVDAEQRRPCTPALNFAPA